VKNRPFDVDGKKVTAHGMMKALNWDDETYLWYYHRKGQVWITDLYKKNGVK
jgi:hypothetical protein